MKNMLDVLDANAGDIITADIDIINEKGNYLFIKYSTVNGQEKIFPAAANAMATIDIKYAEEIIELHQTSFFDAIICDVEFGKKNILAFIAFLKSRNVSQNVPFLLINFQEKANAKMSLTNLKGVDDIITNNISAADLNNKIEILKKYKFFQNKLPYTALSEKKLVNEYDKIDHQYILKRALDITIASVLLILVSPLFLLITIAIKLESKGPVFYKSKRAGRWYKVFNFYKFRTMVVNADSMISDLQYMNEYKDHQTSFFFKLKDDPRVTRVGKFLRKTSLDELPQLINVLKGDMSIVGNRPLPLYEAQTITTDKSAKRFFATAGITGLWQVNGRSNLNLSASERIAMDIDYADKSSLLLDLKILLKTPKELIYKGNV